MREDGKLANEASGGDAGTRIVSGECIDGSKHMASVEASLRESRSGIRAMPRFTELGMRLVAGIPQIDIAALIDRKQLRFMGDAATYAQIALTNCRGRADCPAGLPSAHRLDYGLGRRLTRESDRSC